MGATLPTPVESSVVERHAASGMRVGVAEVNGWRNNMEDAHLILINDDWAFFGVFDGHGGELCSAFVARRLKEELEKDGCPPDDAAVKKLMFKIDKEFLDSCTPSGSTGTMCIVKKHGGSDGKKHLLRVINVGDSRVLLSRSDGTIVDGGGTDQGLTMDHKPDEPSERERIYRCGGYVEKHEGNVARVNGDLAVSRGFGDAEYKKTGGPGPEDHPVTADPEIGVFECDASDFILLVCDGVSEGDFPNPEVTKFVAEKLQDEKDPGAAARAVCHQAIAKDSKDNITCMLVTFDGSVTKASKEVDFTPGPTNSLGHRGFKTAYTAMAERAGYTLAQAVELRYEIVQKRLAGSPDPSEEDQLREELHKLGKPAGAVGSAERTRWFERWVQDLSEDGGGDGPGGMDLSSLLSLAGGRVGGRGPAGLKGAGRGRGGGYGGSSAARNEPEDDERGGSGAGYTWTQTGDEVQVTFRLPNQASKKDVKVEIKPKGLSVAVQGEQLMDGMLAGKVEVEESTWCLAADGSELQVMLTKQSEESWSDLLK